MNWAKIKTVMIILLAAVDVYLGVLLAAQYRGVYLIDEKVMADTVELFAGDGIYIDAGVIPDKKQTRKVSFGAFGDDYRKSLTSALSGTLNFSWHMINNGMKFVLRESSDVYEFYDNDPFGLKYVKNGAAGEGLCVSAEYASELAEYLRYGGDLPGIAEAGSGVKRKMERMVSDFLNPSNEFSGDVGRVSVRLKAVCYDAREDRYAALCIQERDRLPVGQCEAVFIVSGDAVVYAEGALIFAETPESYAVEQYDQINILFMEKDYIDERRALYSQSLEFRIVSVTAEYCVNWNSERTTFYLIPAWRIVYSDGSYRIRNAVTGSVYAI